MSALVSTRVTPPTLTPHFSTYIFEWDGGTWIQTAKLLPDTSDVPTYSSFGSSVALDGDRAFVGATGDNRTEANEASGIDGSGAVYVFTWNANGRASGPYLMRMEAGSFVISQPWC